MRRCPKRKQGSFVDDIADIDGVMTAINKIRQPSDIKNNEEEIIRAGYDEPINYRKDRR